MGTPAKFVASYGRKRMMTTYSSSNVNLELPSVEGVFSSCTVANIPHSCVLSMFITITLRPIQIGVSFAIRNIFMGNCEFNFFFLPFTLSNIRLK